MNAFIRSWTERLGYFAHDWMVILQKVLLNISLFFIYFFGIGFSFILMPLFGRRLIRPFKVKKGAQETYWVNAQGYGNENLEQFNKQV